ncbi:MAG: Fe-S cluster assembly ATPase SufC [Candidatus Gracilibacteria bacterium]
MLKIENLHVRTDGKDILKGLSLTIKSGEIHALMGPNGSGKSTLCNAIMGHPRYEITKGGLTLNGKKITNLETDERANLGLFVAFQNPMEIPGVNFATFLRAAKNIQNKAQKKSKHIDPAEFLADLKKKAKMTHISEGIFERSLNEGFSGGEKKRAEIFQMAVLEPKIAILDEIDSGLDIDALKMVAKNITDTAKRLNIGILIITHYQRILNYVHPDHVHIIFDGKIIKSGEKALAEKLEKEGYKEYITQ